MQEGKKRYTVTLPEDVAATVERIAVRMEMTPAAVIACVLELDATKHDWVTLLMSKPARDVVRHFQRYAARKSETPQPVTG